MRRVKRLKNPLAFLSRPQFIRGGQQITENWLLIKGGRQRAGAPGAPLLDLYFMSPAPGSDIIGSTSIFIGNVNGVPRMAWGTATAPTLIPVAVNPVKNGQVKILAGAIDNWPGAGAGVASLYVMDDNSSAQREFNVII
jgi:hypothetical protein